MIPAGEGEQLGQDEFENDSSFPQNEIKLVFLPRNCGHYRMMSLSVHLSHHMYCQFFWGVGGSGSLTSYQKKKCFHRLESQFDSKNREDRFSAGFFGVTRTA